MVVNVVKFIICFISRHQNVGQIHDIKMAERLSENYANSYIIWERQQLIKI
jgi:hypothetical protein